MIIKNLASIIFILSLAFQGLLSLPQPVLLIKGANPFYSTNASNTSVTDNIKSLTDIFDQAVAYETQYGETTIDENGKVVLAGQSLIKMRNLKKSFSQQIDNLISRSPTERGKTINYIKSIEPGDVNYLYSSSFPELNRKVEIYSTKNNRYTIDIFNGEILGIEPLQSIYSTNVVYRYNQDELLNKVTEYILKIEPEINLSKYKLSVGEKINNYFFRWEDSNQILVDGAHPFIQVGYSINGDFLNYENTLSYINSTSSSSVTVNPNIGPFNEIYANGGSHWGSSGTFTAVTGGYCYLYPNNCPGSFADKSKFYYKNTSGSASGWWTPNSNSNVQAAAFIPSTHATANGKYFVYYNSYYEYFYINQNNYYNTWVNILTDGPWSSGITNIYLTTVGSGSGDLAWDETWVYNP